MTGDILSSAASLPWLGGLLLLSDMAIASQMPIQVPIARLVVGMLLVGRKRRVIPVAMLADGRQGWCLELSVGSDRKKAISVTGRCARTAHVAIWPAESWLMVQSKCRGKMLHRTETELPLSLRSDVAR